MRFHVFPDPQQLFRLAEGSPLIFRVFFLGILTFAVGQMVLALLWMLVGYETVLLGPSTLKLRKTILDIRRTRTFRLSKVSNLRTNPSGMSGLEMYFPTNASRQLGGLVFEYGPKTVRFATAVNDEEAEYLLGKLVPLPITPTPQTSSNESPSASRRWY